MTAALRKLTNAIIFILLSGVIQGQSPLVVARPMGTVKSISGDEVILTTSSGSEIHVTFQSSTRILRTAPGQTTLKDATSMSLSELQIGDRILARGTSSQDGKSVIATSIVVMKQSDIAGRQQQEREDWQKRGLGGLVKSVDAASGKIQISLASFGATKNIGVHVPKSTVIRRYSPDSVKFDDAKPGTLEQIKPGDQLRARGTRSADGLELEAEEIVSGSFRNISGTVQSVDESQNTILVMDLITKRPATVKVTPDSQLRQLPVMFAQGIAMRMKGSASTDTAGGRSDAGAPGAASSSGMRNSGGLGGGGRTGGPPDFQQMLSRLPAVKLPDLHKGDAVMIVTTAGSEQTAPTAITLLSGVEPLLTASPGSTTLLSPWNLGASQGGDTAAQ